VIRVALVIGRLNVGGAEAELVRLANGLDRARFRPFVATLQDAGPLAEDLRDVELVALGRRRKAAPGTFLALRSLLLRRKPDIVQSFLFTENLYCRLAGQGAVVSGLQGPLTEDAEVGSSPSWRLWAERGTFRRARAIVSNSRYYRDLYVRLGFDPARIVVIPSAVALREAPRGGAGIRREFGIPEGRLLVVCVARLVERKGHEDLLRAQGDWTYLFVGDGPCRDRLEGRGAILAGWRRDIPEILAASDVAVLASRFGEGCPNALLEAMAAGKPVVATRAGGTPEVVEDGVTGILVPPGDVEALRAALERLRTDPGLRRKMGEAGRERALRVFSPDRLVRRYEALYSELTGPLPPV